MPKLDEVRTNSRRKSCPKPYLRHHNVVSLLERQLEGDRSTLPIHPHALTAIAKICEVLAVEARAEGDAIHDAEQSAEYHAHAEACDSVASQLYMLVAGITTNNNYNGDHAVSAADVSG